MLTSIHPLGERARNSKWGITAGAYVIGAAAGGIGVGAALGLVGWMLHAVLQPSAAAVAAAAAATAGVALGVDTLAPAVPSIHRQVNEDWLSTYRGWVYGAGFGIQMGLGVATIVPTAATYLTLVLALLSGSPLLGAAMGAAFGLGRGLSILVARRVQSPAALRSLMRRMAQREPLARMAVQGGQLAAVGLALLAVL